MECAVDWNVAVSNRRQIEITNENYQFEEIVRNKNSNFMSLIDIYYSELVVEPDWLSLKRFSRIVWKPLIKYIFIKFLQHLDKVSFSSHLIDGAAHFSRFASHSFKQKTRNKIRQNCCGFCSPSLYIFATATPFRRSSTLYTFARCAPWLTCWRNKNHIYEF